ncbi:MAG: discoidin domain-containing protein [Eubacterium sp.]
MYDSDGNIKQDAYDNVKPENAVDGKTNTSFTSYQGDDQWIYVDLQKEYTLGRVVINWNSDAGKIYDVEVSSDAKNWKTVHRVQKGYANMTDNFTMYQKNVRYVRVLGYTKVESGSGFGISELSVYEYDGDSKENETISELPKDRL